MLRKVLDKVSMDVMIENCDAETLNYIVREVGSETLVEDPLTKQVKLDKSQFGLSSYTITTLLKSVISMLNKPKEGVVYVTDSNGNKHEFPNKAPYDAVTLLKSFKLSESVVPISIGLCIHSVLDEIDELLKTGELKNNITINEDKSSNAHLLKLCRDEMFNLLKEADFFECLGITLS